VRIEAKESKDPRVLVIQAVPTTELITQLSPANNAELQGRIAIPISALILVILAIPLSFVDPRSGRSGNMVMAILTFIIYTNLMSITQAWLVQGKLNPMIGLWPVHLIFLFLTIYLFYRRTHQLPLLPKLIN